MSSIDQAFLSRLEITESGVEIFDRERKWARERLQVARWWEDEVVGTDLHPDAALELADAMSVAEEWGVIGRRGAQR